ncbi:MAG: hypothetical protein HKN41_03985 [Ilumatobacter sp.]|nr:hypothetical protein [Ilumatobacter sp.]
MTSTTLPGSTTEFGHGVLAAQRRAIASLAEPGDWLTGPQRVDAWRHTRAAETDQLDRRRAEALSPNAVDGEHGASAHLAADAVEVVHRVASDPGRLVRSWADQRIDALGEEVYTELVGVVAIASVVDRFHDALGVPRPDLPEPADGEPARERPDGLGDAGAWIAQTTQPGLANVARTLSLVPVTNSPWRELVISHYSRGPAMAEPVWDGALSRPQIELVASRTTALNECFY